MNTQQQDECTGLYNASHLSSILDTEIFRSEQYGYEFSLLALTLEGLQELEGSIGHLALNRLLAEVGQTTKAAGRLIDFAFHRGDGDFLLLLPQTAKQRGSEFTRQVRESLVERVWLTGQGHNVRLNVTAGMVTYPEDGKTKAELLQSLDKTMYFARGLDRQRDLISTAHRQGRAKKALRLLGRGLDISSEFVAKALIGGANSLERIWTWTGSTLGELLLLGLIVAFVVGLIWVVKWLWVHLPV